MTAAAVNSATVREQILEARETHEQVRVVGRGQWLDAGRPVTAGRALDVSAHTGIVEYVPGDLTLTARGGTTLAEIASATGVHGQWLALDPFGTPDGTIGATVATASSGPLAHAFGSPRDQVLGMELVSGNGEVIRAGGKVVKNVAGFDLTRLFTGSWGTLGVITEVTVRLRALPTVEAHVAIALPDDRPDAIAAFVREAMEVRAAPLAMELLSGALSEKIGLDAATTLLFRLGGNLTSVAAQRAALAALGRVTEVSADVWTNLRMAEPSGAVVFRVAAWPDQFARAWQAVREACSQIPNALVHGTPSRGTVRVILADVEPSRTGKLLATMATEFRITGERLPREAWAALPTGKDDASAAVLATLMRRVKDTYDPMHLLNPGILGEEIA